MRVRFITLFAISFLYALSCSVTGPPRTHFVTPAVSAGPTSAPLGPSAVDWIENRLARFQMGLSDAETHAVAEAIIRESERHGLEWDLVLAVMRVESGFNNFARSHMGALGLMQVMPRTGERLARRLAIDWRGPGTLFEPVTNVRIGTAYLALMLQRYNRLDRALAAYNWGPAAIDRRLRRGSPVPDEYVTLVMTALQSTPRP